MRYNPSAWAAALLVLAGCQAGPRETPAARLFEGMGPHHRTVTTRSPQAQQYFDQGLTWAYGFNHAEAIRSFRAAAAADDGCAMAWWGVALCNGPHVNNPVVTEAEARAAWEAVQQAQARKAGASPVEQALIDAVAQRYSADPRAPRPPLDEAYAAAMERVYRAYPDDVDVATLYAEALMDLQPWDYWTRDGQPKGRAAEVLAVLEGVLARAPDHPGANHYYIHAVEAGPHPEKAQAAADRLRGLVPMSSHLTHMPAHIDVRTGQWAAAADANVRAMAADRRYRALAPKQGFYHVYMMHNRHFLAYAAMMEGRRAEALAAARDMIAFVPADWARLNAALADPYMAIELQVMMRFGLWDEILSAPAPAEHFPITVAHWRFMRAVAWGARGDLPRAAAEQQRFAEAVRAVPADALMAINPAHHVLRLAGHMLAGELAFRRGDLDAAVTELRRAADLEDQLKYMEPPEWPQPVRHTLGAVLVSAGRHAEAEQVYRADLERWPGNGWSLFGLAQSLRGQGKAAEAAAAQERFEAAWSRADTTIDTTCKCVVLPQAALGR